MDPLKKQPLKEDSGNEKQISQPLLPPFVKAGNPRYANATSQPALPPLPVNLGQISLSPQEMARMLNSKGKTPPGMMFATPKTPEEIVAMQKSLFQYKLLGQDHSNMMMPSISPPALTNEGNPMPMKGQSTFPPQHAMMPMMIPHSMPAFPALQQSLPIPVHKVVYFDCAYPHCKERFNKTKNLYAHLRKAHNTDYACPHCSNKSGCMANFVSHVRTHTKEKPWPCPHMDCKYRGKTKNHSKCHVIQNHGLEVLQANEDFFMQDRVCKAPGNMYRNTTSLKRKHPMQIAPSLMKRTKRQHLNLFMNRMSHPLSSMPAMPNMMPMMFPSLPPNIMNPMMDMSNMGMNFVSQIKSSGSSPEESIQNLLNFNQKI